MLDLIIIGGGIAGLTSAFFAKKQKLNFLLLEASNKLGGSIRTKNINNQIIECGSTGLRAGSVIKEIIKDLSLEILTRNKKANKHFIYYKDSLYSQNQILGFKAYLDLIGKVFFRVKALKEKESIKEFADRVLGQEISEKVISAMINGLYAGDYSILSKSLFPKFLKSNSLIYFKKGLNEFTDSMADFIEHNNIKLNTEVLEIQENNNYFEVITKDLKLEASKIILAVPAYKASKIYVKYLSRLSEIEYLAVINIACEIPYKQAFENYVGFLSSNNSNTELLGLIHSSNLFKVNNKMILNCFLGGHKNPQIIQKTDQEIISIIKTELNKIYNFNEINILNIERWPQAMPQYKINHEDIFKEIILPKGLYLCGNYSKGISIEEVVRLSKEVLLKL